MEIFNTPILFLVFNRPDVTAKVFDQIKLIRPKYLYVACDGPRNGSEDDILYVKKVRELILSSIDWDCELKILFRDENLGCGKAVSSAITWFFENVEEGIILEDDCLPRKEFFEFCSKLLSLYRDNKKIMHIGGVNFQNGLIRGDASYYFSKYIHVWGWATWRNAWQSYQLQIDNLEKLIGKKAWFINNYEKEYWLDKFEKTRNGLINTWDYQWLYTCIINDGLSVIPNVNLIENIGFGDNATHTKSIKYSPVVDETEFKIIHPKNVFACSEADKYTALNHYHMLTEKSLWNKFKIRIRTWL